MMQGRRLVKVLFLLLASGVVLSAVSLLYEKTETFGLLSPCIYGPVTVPSGKAWFGFPLDYITRSDFVQMTGCGPIFGRFSNYSFCPIKFMINTGFYALIIVPTVLLIYHRILRKKPNDLHTLTIQDTDKEESNNKHRTSMSARALSSPSPCALRVLYQYYVKRTSNVRFKKKGEH
jgi:hypothetical protein